MTKNKRKREIAEWLVLVAVAATLYFTGYHTPVIGFIQRMVLSTGILNVNTAINHDIPADYNFKVSDIDGQSLSFQDLKGKTIFMNFWATWCPPCIAEMPDINDLYLEMKDEVVFVMVSVDQSHDKAIDFINRKSFDFPIYFPVTSIPTDYKSNAIPYTVVISPEGKIVTKKEGMAKYNTEAFRSFLRSLN